MKSRPDFWKCQVVRDLAKNRVFVKILEAVRPAENVDGRDDPSTVVRDEPSCEKSTRLLEMSGGERLRKKSCICEDTGGGEAG